MENNLDDLHTFTLCRDDWQIVIDSLYAREAHLRYVTQTGFNCCFAASAHGCQYGFEELCGILLPPMPG